MTPTTTQREADRAAFEAHHRALIAATNLPPEEAESRFYRTETGRYFAGWMQSQWEGWQAAWTASRQAAMEECAEIADKYATDCQQLPTSGQIDKVMLETMAFGLREVSAAIRQRKEASQ